MMKTTLKTIAVMMMVATMVLAGCKKEIVEPETPVTPEEPRVENVFPGTSWESSVENNTVIRDEGYSIPIHVVADMSIDFLDTTNCEFFLAVEVEYTTYPLPPRSGDFTYECTYAFNGKDTLLMTVPYEDEETGEEGVDTMCLVYDTVAKTLTMDWNDDDMAELLGTDVVVFTQVEVDSSSKTTIPGNGRGNATSAHNGWRKLMGRVFRALNK